MISYLNRIADDQLDSRVIEETLRVLSVDQDPQVLLVGRQRAQNLRCHLRRNDQRPLVGDVGDLIYHSILCGDVREELLVCGVVVFHNIDWMMMVVHETCSHSR